MKNKRYQIAKSYTVASKRYIIFSTNNRRLWDIAFYLYSKYYKNKLWLWGWYDDRQTKI